MVQETNATGELKRIQNLKKKKQRGYKAGEKHYYMKASDFQQLIIICSAMLLQAQKDVDDVLKRQQETIALIQKLEEERKMGEGGNTADPDVPAVESNDIVMEGVGVAAIDSKPDAEADRVPVLNKRKSSETEGSEMGQEHEEEDEEEKPKKKTKTAKGDDARRET
jgi:hypothetical protein